MTDEETLVRLEKIERMLQRILELILEDFDPDEEDEDDEDLFERAMRRRDWEKWVI